MISTRDAGKREADIGFNVGQGTQDLGFRNSVPILFHCVPAIKVVLGVKDFDGQPTTASFTFRDKLGTHLPESGAAARSRFLFPKPGLPRRRRIGFAPPGRIHRGDGSRARISDSTLDARSQGERRRSGRTFTWSLDPSGGPALVFRRPSCARGRMCPLRQPNRRGDAGRHDAAHHRGRFERRLRAELGSLLVHAEAVFRGKSLGTFRGPITSCGTTSR